MNSAQQNYWEECLATSFEEHGIIVTDLQLKAIADDIQNSHENIGLAFHVPENPLIPEVANLKRELKKEREKVTCDECHGTGNIITYGGTLQFQSSCLQCNGEGRYIP